MKIRNIITKAVVLPLTLGVMYIYAPSVNASPLFDRFCQVFSIVSGQSESRKQRRAQREHIMLEKKRWEEERQIFQANREFELLKYKEQKQLIEEENAYRKRQDERIEHQIKMEMGWHDEQKRQQEQDRADQLRREQLNFASNFVSSFRTQTRDNYMEFLKYKVLNDLTEESISNAEIAASQMALSFYNKVRYNPEAAQNLLTEYTKQIAKVRVLLSNAQKLMAEYKNTNKRYYRDDILSNASVIKAVEKMNELRDILKKYDRFSKDGTASIPVDEKWYDKFTSDKDVQTVKKICPKIHEVMCDAVADAIVVAKYKCFPQEAAQFLDIITHHFDIKRINEDVEQERAKRECELQKMEDDLKSDQLLLLSNLADSYLISKEENYKKAYNQLKQYTKKVYRQALDTRERFNQTLNHFIARKNELISTGNFKEASEISSEFVKLYLRNVNTGLKDFIPERVTDLLDNIEVEMDCRNYEYACVIFDQIVEILIENKKECDEAIKYAFFTESKNEIIKNFYEGHSVDSVYKAISLANIEADKAAKQCDYKRAFAFLCAALKAAGLELDQGDREALIIDPLTFADKATTGITYTQLSRHILNSVIEKKLLDEKFCTEIDKVKKHSLSLYCHNQNTQAAECCYKFISQSHPYILKAKDIGIKAANKALIMEQKRLALEESQKSEGKIIGNGIGDAIKHYHAVRGTITPNWYYIVKEDCGSSCNRYIIMCDTVRYANKLCMTAHLLDGKIFLNSRILEHKGKEYYIVGSVVPTDVNPCLYKLPDVPLSDQLYNIDGFNIIYENKQ